MSRGLTDPEPDENDGPVSTDEIMEVSVGNYFMLELVHKKLDMIMEHLGIERKVVADEQGNQST